MLILLWRRFLPYFLGGLVVFVVLLPFIGVKIYDYWKDFISDKDGYNGINAAIAYSGGILNIITIIFLYINYREQKKQNDDQQADVEFNRALSIVNSQLPLTERHYINNIKEQEESTVKTLDSYIEILERIEHSIFLHEDPIIHQGDFKKNFTLVLFKTSIYVGKLERMLNLYLKLVYNKKFNEGHISILTLILIESFWTEVNRTLSRLIPYIPEAYSKYKEVYNAELVTNPYNKEKLKEIFDLHYTVSFLLMDVENGFESRRIKIEEYMKKIGVIKFG